MTSWGSSVRALVVGAALLAACSDDGPDASTTTSSTSSTSSSTTSTTVAVRPTSTTTTVHDPGSVEGEIEAAYLRSWDVYAEAVFHLELDEEALAEVYAGEGLENMRSEIEGRTDDGRAALVRVEHQYEVVITNEEIASVVDHLTNHQVLIDPVTKEPVEDDPDEAQILNFVMNRVDGAWKVSLVQRIG